MSVTRTTRRIGRAGLALVLAAAFSMLACSADCSSRARGPPAAAGPSLTAAAGTVGAHHEQVDPLTTNAGPRTSATHYECQDRPIDGSEGVKCFAPAQLQTAYGLTPMLKLGINGKGRTIVIVDAYANPYLAADLTFFNTLFDLPTSTLRILHPYGVPVFDPFDYEQVNWAGETTVDVLWAHAMAPGATIVLVQAPSSRDTDMLAATKYAVDHNLGDVISQSFGQAENCASPGLLSQEHTVFAQAVQKGITLLASTGDSGAAMFNCAGTGAMAAVSSPASDPYVTAVGGTSLSADAKGKYQSETAWDDVFFGCRAPASDPGDQFCSGGGHSSVYATPSFQAGFVAAKSGRGIPDVAYNAGLNGGVLTPCGACSAGNGNDPTDPNRVTLFGGTSVGTPQWAALVADADQLGGHRIGNLNPILYGVGRLTPAYRSSFHDIIVGQNKVTELNDFGYQTARGWDAVTGLGTPVASALLPWMAGSAR